MMDFSQADALWKAITSHGLDPIKQHEKAIEFIQWLLENTCLTNEDLLTLSRSEGLTDFFIDYVNTSDHLISFFNRSLPHIEKSLHGSRFEEKIQLKKQQLADIKAQSENIIESHKELLAAKNALESESEKLAQLESEVQALLTLEEQVKPEFLEALEKKNIFLKSATEGKTQNLYNLKEENARLIDLEKQIETNLTQLKTSNEQHTEHILMTSSTLCDEIDTAWEKMDDRLSDVVNRLAFKQKEYDRIKNEIDKRLLEFDEVRKTVETNNNIFELHCNTNRHTGENITSKLASLNSYSGMKLPDFTKKISELSEGIQTELQKFDSLLKEAVMKYEEVKNNIKVLHDT